MRLKIILDEGILGRTHKIWVNPPDLYYVSDLTEFLSNYLSLGSTFDLFLQDFFIHPDLLVNEILQDSDELVLKSPEPEKTKIQSFSLQPKKEENFKKDFKKQSKNFKKEMKKNPKILKFSGTVTKFSKNSEENLKNPKISPVCPHDLQVGDQIRFTSLSCTSLKFAKVLKIKDRQVKLLIFSSNSDEKSKNAEKLLLDKGNFLEIMRVKYN